MTVVTADDRRFWAEPAFVAVVLATLSAALAVEFIVPASMGVRHRYDAAQLAVALLARETAALLTLDLLAKRYLGVTWADLGLQRVRWGQVAFGVVFGLILMVLSAVLLAKFGVGAEAYIAQAAAAGTLPWQLALFALVGVYSPVVQELVFRGLVLQGLLQRMPVWPAIALSSVIFALAHLGAGAGSLIDAFLFGILSGVLYVRFGSLTAPIAAHIAVNSFTMLSILWALHRAGPFGGWAR